MIQVEEGRAPYAMATAKELRRLGREARKDVPRSALGELSEVDRDPIALIEQQNQARVPSLVPLRTARMAVSPFTFFRGSAGLMALDLRRQVDTGVHVVVCGDAHIGNFGIFASPERRLVFDLNDFDEAAPGPWEWDVKRMAASVVLAALDRGMSEAEAANDAMAAVSGYREGLRWMASLEALDRYYLCVDEEVIANNTSEDAQALFAHIAKKATRRTSEQAVRKLMSLDDRGRYRFHEEPPVLMRTRGVTGEQVMGLFESYRRTVRPDIALLLSRYQLTDAARRVVGVGSVGTRCFVLALTGPGQGHLILQMKEALPSVVTAASQPNGTTPRTLPPDAPEGERVIVHQQILQAVSDPFLGHLEADGHHFYVRQFRDMKGSVDFNAMTKAQFNRYAFGCGLLLARGHGQSPYAHWIAGYMGGSDCFDRAITRWSLAYARQAIEDHRRMLDAIASGRLATEASEARAPVEPPRLHY